MTSRFINLPAFWRRRWWKLKPLSDFNKQLKVLWCEYLVGGNGWGKCFVATQFGAIVALNLEFVLSGKPKRTQFCCTLEITSFNRGVAHLVETWPYVPKKMSIDHGFYHLLDSPGKCVINFFTCWWQTCIQITDGKRHNKSALPRF